MATIQIRNVPDEVALTLKRRALESGQSLQEFMLAHVKAEAAQPTVEELLAELENRQYRRDNLSAESVVSAVHDAREERTGRIVSSVDRPSQ